MTSRLARPAVLVIAVVLVLAAAGAASGTATAPRYDEQGRLIETPFVPAPDEPQLHEKLAIELALSVPEDRGLGRALSAGRADEDRDLRRREEGVGGQGLVGSQGRRPDRARDRRRRRGAGGHGGLDGPPGRLDDGPRLRRELRQEDQRALDLVALCPPSSSSASPIFRRPLSLRNLDLLVLLSFSASWWFFNEADLHVGAARLSAARLPARAYGLAGNTRTIDGAVHAVLAGVAARRGDRFHARRPDQPEPRGVEHDRRRLRGRHRRSADRDRGSEPVRQLPGPRRSRECGEPERDGDVRDRVQTNGRCETANERGDTYGPISYVAYIPGFLATGWSGKWDRPRCPPHTSRPSSSTG